MQKILTLSLVMLSTLCYSQEEIIKLKPEPVMIELAHFYISAVIDGRQNQTSVGVAQRGPFNRKVNADLAGGAAMSIEQYLKAVLPSDSGKTPIVIKITHLKISEKTTLASETGRAEVRLAFYKNTGGSLMPIYESEASAEDAGIDDVTSGHERRIRSALITCIKRFNDALQASGNIDYEAIEYVQYNEQGMAETPSHSDMETVRVQRDNLLTYNRIYGANAAGWGLTYYQYIKNDTGNWIIPWVIASERFTIFTDNFNQLNYREATLNYLMPGISAFRRLSDRLYINLTLVVPMGSEILITSNGSRTRNVLIGLSPSQCLYFIPKSNFGLTFGAGAYQRILSSLVYQTDYGLKVEAGVKF